MIYRAFVYSRIKHTASSVAMNRSASETILKRSGIIDGEDRPIDLGGSLRVCTADLRSSSS